MSMAMMQVRVVRVPVHERGVPVSTIPLFDGSAITKFDVLPASASRLL